MLFVAIFGILLLGASANPFEEVNDVLTDYFTGLDKDGVLDFEIVLQGAKFYDDGSVTYRDTLAFVSKRNKSAQFKLSSLGKKRIAKLIETAEDEGVQLSVLHENFVKNTTKNYDTEMTENDSPAAKIVREEIGFVGGMLIELADTLFETSGVAKIKAVEFFPDKKIKRKISLTIHAKKVTVKASKSMSAKMIEDSKTLLKKSFKVDADDRASIIANVFEKGNPDYSWQIYINPVAYTVKADVMAKFKYDNETYVVLGNKI